jgi:hypothetical protein
MAVKLENNAKGVLDIDHAVGFLLGGMFPHRHPLLAVWSDDFLKQAFEVGVLDGEMKGAVLPEGQVFVGRVVAVELEQLEPDPRSPDAQCANGSSRGRRRPCASGRYRCCPR